MFDLVDKLSKKQPETKPRHENCALFFQTHACSALIQKAFRFEALAEPRIFENQPEQYEQLTNYQDIEVVMVELNQSDNIVESAKQITHHLPPHISVIIIGQEDAISTVRALRNLGFYYLFWPANAVEVTEFYADVVHNHQQHKGASRNRKAKQLVFMGVKGGVGTSLIASEVSRSLAKHHNANTLLVDHTYSGSNIDVMLGLKKFSKRSVQKGTLISGIDNDFASSLVQKIDHNLSILALDSDQFSRKELHQYTQALKQQVIQDNTFIVEDYSHAVTTNEEFDSALQNVNTLVLVFDATVSSLRELNRMTSEIEKRNPELNVLTVMNRSRPNNSASISESDVEKYFGRSADTNVPFDHKANQYLLQGLLIGDSQSNMKQGLQALVARLVGEKARVVKRNILRNLFKG